MIRKRYHLKPANKNKFQNIYLGLASVFGIFALFVIFYNILFSKSGPSSSEIIPPSYQQSCIIQEFDIYLAGSDQDGDLVDDQIDFLKGALARTQVSERYIDTYYSTNNGKPPENEGVCTDLIWRAFESAGYDFQEILYQDMSRDKNNYPLHIWQTSQLNKNIDFRRVPNLNSFFEKYAQQLTTEVIPCDYENLNQWQGGDIVIFSLKRNGFADHIGIVSARRDEQGVPYIIHNWGRGSIEDMNWFGDVVKHYRIEFERLPANI